jgi:hypothetical protein
MNLENLGVQEMNKNEMKKTQGGILFLLLYFYPWHMSGEMQAHNQALLMK